MVRKWLCSQENPSIRGKAASGAPQEKSPSRRNYSEHTTAFKTEYTASSGVNLHVHHMCVSVCLFWLRESVCVCVCLCVCFNLANQWLSH
jgi:hypothetical protein